MSAVARRETATRLREAALAWRRGLGWLLAAVLALTLGCAPKPPGRSTVMMETPPDLEALYREIQALEFIRGLKLSQAQGAKLITALEPFEARLTETNAQRRSLEQELVKLLLQRKAALISGEDVSAEGTTRVAEIRRSLLPESRLDAQRESELAMAVRAVLTVEQIAAMPSSLDARAQAQDMLDGFRELSSDEFEAQIRPFSEDLVSQSPAVPADQVEALFREARTLADGEYQQSCSVLVDQLMPMFAPSEEATDWLLADAFTQEGMLDLLRQIADGSDKASS